MSGIVAIDGLRPLMTLMALTFHMASLVLQQQQGPTPPAGLFRNELEPRSCCNAASGAARKYRRRCWVPAACESYPALPSGAI